MREDKARTWRLASEAREGPSDALAALEDF